MAEIYLVMMRQPDGPQDARFEAYWEGGSFGRTGCHGRNLLHHRNCPIRTGDRLAFIQGYRGEFRVIGLTPPVDRVSAIGSGRRLEILWDSRYRPFRYEEAPVLVNNAGGSHFPAFASELHLGGRTTPVGAISSQFRTRATPLPANHATEIARICDSWSGAVAANYIETIRPPGDSWRELALRKGWADPDHRRRRYEAMGKS